MKKLICTAAFIMGMQALMAQTDTSVLATQPTPPTDRPSPSIDLSTRGNDHLLVQFGADSWGSVPDSIRTKGFSRHFNIYFMLDKPFKNNPKLSAAFGVGIGSSNIFFDRMYVDLKAPGTTLPFVNLEDAQRFKKFKLTTVYAEAPVELRFSSNPADAKKSYKFAVGGKVGMLLSAHTKGKNLESATGESISNHIEKEKSKKFINGTRLSATARVGYGLFSLHASYQITNFLREGAGPEIRPFSIGLTLSGL